EEDLRIPFIVSWKNKVPENRRTNSLISVVDLAPTFLTLAGREKPLTMAGLDVSQVWLGQAEKAREWVIAENHFQRTKFYQKPYIEDRYEVTWYMHSDEGELCDLEEDPDEFHNLWDKKEHQLLKLQLLHRAMKADMAKETCWMPRIGPA